MDGQIIPRSIVLELAKEAAKPGALVVAPWPIGTAAGQMFQREVEFRQALQQASRRVAEGAHG